MNDTQPDDEYRTESWWSLSIMAALIVLSLVAVFYLGALYQHPTN